MEKKKKKTAAAALPDDLLSVVLGRLAARSLAASRGVCKAWRDLIDERRLLLRLLVVRGLFINYEKYGRSTYFLSRPTSTSSPEDSCYRRIDGKFDFIAGEQWEGATRVVDHCNGLVLFSECYGTVMHVCNPTMQWSARLPPWTGGATYDYSTLVSGRRAFLVFDPFVSPEYKVLLSPVEPVGTKTWKDDPRRLMEWPPSAWKAWQVFSSSTGMWEEKVFHRDGEAVAETVGDLLPYQFCEEYDVQPPCRYAAYWNGALYVHCHGEFVARLSLMDDKYRVIKSPVQLVECKNHRVQSFLGRSEKGVYIAAIGNRALDKLRVWTLCESGGQMEWVLKDQSNLKIISYSWWKENNKFDKQKYWILDHDGGRRKNQDMSLVEQNVCWNSDNDNIVDVSVEEKDFLRCVTFLGFHPYKEVIFLYSEGYAVAFDLNRPKVQYLGTVHLGGEHHRGMRESFVYTPYLIVD